MKEQDLNKHLDNIIIKGLIREAQQDDADLEAAIRKISDEDFERIVGRERRKITKFPKRKLLQPWLVSTVAAVVVILIVLIPTVTYMNNMDGKLCDSALYASEYFISPARGGFDVATASTEEIEKELPSLEAQYKELATPGKNVDKEMVYEFEEAGWNLAVAYLRLHKKNDAVAVLQVLAYGDYPHGDTGINEHCAELLKYLK